MGLGLCLGLCLTLGFAMLLGHVPELHSVDSINMMAGACAWISGGDACLPASLAGNFFDDFGASMGVELGV